MKKKLATVMAATMAVSGSVVSVSAATTEEQLVGSNRTDTAVKISKEGWTKAETVILVNDAAIPDALTATPLAYAKNAPILLTGKGGLTKATADEIKRLGAKDVIMIGGDAVLTSKVEEDLKALNVKTDRIKGASREETALAIAKRLDGVKDVSEIAVVNGVTGLADAVSVAAAAAEKGMPILLANPKSGLSVVEKFIKDEAIKSSFIIGGDKAVSNEIAKNLPGKQRIEGANRNDTNAKVIETFYADKNLDNLYLAKDGMENSGQLIDALAVGALAAKNGAPVLIASKKLNANQVNVVNTKKIATIIQVGGKGNEGAFNQLKEIEKAEVIKVKNEAELQEALKKANANDTIEIDANATISKDVTLSTNNAIEINVKGDLTGKVTVKTPNADIKNSGTIGTLVVENGKNTTVTNTSAGKISKVEVSSSSENVKVENNGTITEVKNDGEGTKVDNEGTISKPITGTETPNVEGNKPGGSTSSGGSSGGSSAPTYTTGATVNGEYHKTVAEAVAAAKAEDTVTVYGTNKLSSQLVINKKINLVGADSQAIIEAGNNFTAETDAKQNLISIENTEKTDSAKGATISNLTIRNAVRNGLHVFKVKDVVLNDLVVEGSKNGGGIVVNGSTVTATNIKTSDNAWYGINVDKKNEDGTKLTLSGAKTNIAEPIQIFAEKTEEELVDWKGAGNVHKYLEIANPDDKHQDYYEKGYIYSNRAKEEFKEGAVVKPATKEVQVVGKYYKDVKKAITDSINESTVEIYGEYTIPANKTVEVKGTVTGTIKGTDSTSKLIIGKDRSYGNLAEGVYIWNTSSWTKINDGITKGDELVENNGKLSTSFIWSSSENIGTNSVENDEKTNGLSYYKDGSYLRLQVKKNNDVVAFKDVFKSVNDSSTDNKHDADSNKCGLLLKTTTVKGTNVATPKYNDLDGSTREKADWNDVGGYGDKDYKGTDLDNNENSKYIFYGVRQGGETTELKKSRTVGFAAGDVREIELVLNPLENLDNGTYTVTIQSMKQENCSTDESDKKLGNEITYTFTVTNKVITVNNK